MAITGLRRYAGDELVSVSSIPKPTNLEDGAKLWEVDTKLIYILSGNTWFPMTGPSGQTISTTTGLSGDGVENWLTYWSSPSGLNATQITGYGNILVTFGLDPYPLISISGDTGAYATFATTANLTQTGITLRNDIAGLSGALNQTGSSLYNLATNQLSGLKVTGSNTLINTVDITGVGLVRTTLSGQTIFISGVTDNSVYLLRSETGQFGASGNLTQTGITLHDEIVSLSGALNTTGSNLYNLASNQLSGLKVTGSNTLIGTVDITGVGLVRTILSGQTVFISGVTDNSVYLLRSETGQFGTSGNLTQTGVQLGNIIAGLSGALVSTGNNLQSQITAINLLASNQLTGLRVTGSNVLIGTVDFTGVGTTRLTLSGQTVFVSGVSEAANFVLKSETGQFGASGNLTQTGITLYNQITGLSGYLTSFSNIYDVKRFGASGNGRVDDRQAIQACIEFAAASSGYVYLSPGTYRVGTSGHNTLYLLTGRPNVSIFGDGDVSTILVGSGLNSVGASQEFNVIYQPNGSPALVNATFSNFRIDFNGIYNKVPSNLPLKNNIGIGAYSGSGITVSNVTFYNNPGTQCLSFGNNTSPHSCSKIKIVNNRFDTVGGAVSGNINAADHSCIWIQSEQATIANNIFYNPVSGMATAIEDHCNASVVEGNSIEGFSIGVNVVAEYTDHKENLYTSNVFRNVNQAFRVWNFADRFIDNLSITNNVIHSQNCLLPIIDFNTYVEQNINSVDISNNTINCTDSNLNHSEAGILAGPANFVNISKNKIIGVPGRAISTVGSNDPAPSTYNIVIDDNKIYDCCRTFNSSHKDAISLRTLVPYKSVAITNNLVQNSSGQYIKNIVGGFGDTELVRIENNYGINISGTEIDWTQGNFSHFYISHRGSGNPESLVLASVGSEWFDIPNKTLYIKKLANSTTTGWRRHFYSGFVPGTSSTYRDGDTIENTVMAEYRPEGWKYVGNGTNGFWTGYGLIGAKPNYVLVGRTSGLISSGQIYDDGSNLGFGTTNTPQRFMFSGGNVGIPNDYAIVFYDTFSSGFSSISTSTSNNLLISSPVNGGNFQVMSQYPHGHFIVYTSGANERFRVSANGNVSIGGVSATAMLDVTGQVRIRGGTPGNGKVLTSDANGLATWSNDLKDLITGVSGMVSPTLTGTTYQFVTFENNTLKYLPHQFSPINVRNFGAAGNGVNDDTVPLQAAISSVRYGQSRVYIPSGRYLITSELRITGDRTIIYGDGPHVTQIYHTPSTSGVLFRFDNNPSQLFQCGINNLSILTNAYNLYKVGIEGVDLGFFNIENIAFFNYTGAGSIGVRARGREMYNFTNVTIDAAQPIVIEDNPNHDIDSDHYNFKNLYLSSSNNFPLITIRDGVNVSAMSFEGYQAWNGGIHGFYWNSPSNVISSNNITMRNVRYEQCRTPTGWAVYINAGGNLQQFLSEDGETSLPANGFYMNKVRRALIQSYVHGTNSGTGLASQNGHLLKTENCFFQTGARLYISGMSLKYMFNKVQTECQVPDTATWELLPFNNNTPFFVSGNANFANNLTTTGDVTVGGTARIWGDTYLDTDSRIYFWPDNSGPYLTTISAVGIEAFLKGGTFNVNNATGIKLIDANGNTRFATNQIGNTYLGFVTITGGSPSAGKVLTASDTQGTATWSNPTAGVPNTITGNGTQDYLAKFTPNQTGLVRSQIYDNGTNIGFATTNVPQKYNFAGGNMVIENDKFYLINDSNTSGYAEITVSTTNNFNFFSPINGTGNFQFVHRNPNGSVIFYTSGVNERLRISPNGNVGIGGVAGTVMLDVTGQIRVRGGTPGAGKVLTSDAGGTATWETPSSSSASIPLATTGRGTVNYLSRWVSTSGLGDSYILQGNNTLSVGTSSEIVMISGTTKLLGDTFHGINGKEYFWPDNSGPYIAGVGADSMDAFMKGGVFNIQNATGFKFIDANSVNRFQVDKVGHVTCGFFSMTGNNAASGKYLMAVDPTGRATWVTPSVSSNVTVKDENVVVGTRAAIAFYEGANVSLTISDNAINDTVDVTINSTEGGGGGYPSLQYGFSGFTGDYYELNNAYNTVKFSGAVLAHAEPFQTAELAAGTWLVTACCKFSAITTDNGSMYLRLYNPATSTILTGSEKMWTEMGGATLRETPVTTQAQITIGTPTNIIAQAMDISNGGHRIYAYYATMSWLRLA